MKKTRLTKEKALELTFELWKWLGEHPNAKKYDWPGWEKYSTGVTYCFICDYVEQKTGEYPDEADVCFKYCILIDLWPNIGSTGSYSPCCIEPSPFIRWDTAKTPKTRKKYAKIISDYCTKMLDEINLKEDIR